MVGLAQTRCTLRDRTRQHDARPAQGPASPAEVTKNPKPQISGARSGASGTATARGAPGDRGELEAEAGSPRLEAGEAPEPQKAATGGGGGLRDGTPRCCLTTPGATPQPSGQPQNPRVQP